MTLFFNNFGGQLVITSSVFSPFPYIQHGFTVGKIKDLPALPHQEPDEQTVNLLFPQRMVVLKQVHGVNCIQIETNAKNLDNDLSEDLSKYQQCNADAVMSDIPGLLAAVTTADCVPVLLASNKKSGVAAIHAGWRGTLEGITSKTLKTFLKKYQLEPGNIYAAIGPSICDNCYRVGPEVYHLFNKKFNLLQDQEEGAENQKYYLNLASINYWQLLKAGVPASHIDLLPLCTRCLQDYFFSYRGDGKLLGRQFNFIGINRYWG